MGSVLIRRIARFAFLAFAAGSFSFAPVAFAAREDAAMLSTTAGGGAGFGVLQTISLFRHLYKADELDETPELKHLVDADEAEENLRRREAYPLSYNLGYAYNLTATSETKTDQAMIDQAHSFVGGVDLELMPTLSVALQSVVTSIPSESYNQGALVLRGDYVFNFARKQKVVRHLRKKDLRNSSIYYRQFLDRYGVNPRGPIGADEIPDVPDEEDRLNARTRQQLEDDRREAEAAKRAFHEERSKNYVDEESEDEKVADPEEVFPNLRIGLAFAYYRRNRETFVPSRTSRAVGSGSDFTLNSGSFQSELVYSPSEVLAFRGAVSLFHYSRAPNSLVQLFEQSAGVRQGGLSLPGLAGALSQLMAMPDTSFDFAATYYASELWTAELTANYMIFATSAGNAIAFTPALYRAIGRRWNVGGGVEVSIGDSFNVAGSASLSYFF